MITIEPMATEDLWIATVTLPEGPFWCGQTRLSGTGETAAEALNAALLKLGHAYVERAAEVSRLAHGKDER